jgi:hypothetical protein
MTTGTCCANSLSKDYVVELAESVVQDNYTFAVLRSTAKKRVVITLTGTKEKSQLLKEGWYSNLVAFGDASKKMFISDYFNTVFTQVKVLLKPKLVELVKKYPDFQFIFTGHSLGGAMSTLFALDSVLDGYLPVSSSSPALINYASPRVGNYVFASHVMYYVPIVYRLVRNGDPVVSIPPCSYIMKCSNKLGREKFTRNLNDFTGKDIPDDKGYWHIAGLMLYNNDMTSFTDCGKEYSENPINPSCNPSAAMSVQDHTYYMAKSVSGVCQGARRFFFSKKVLKQFK